MELLQAEALELKPDRPPYAGGWAAVGIIVMQQLYMIPLLLPAFVFDHFRRTHLRENAVVLTLVMFIATWLVWRHVKRAWRISWLEVCGPLPSRKAILLAVVTKLGILCAEFGAFSLLSRIWPGLVTMAKAVELPFERSFWLLIPLVIAAPLTEEFIFRGLALRAAMARRGAWTAILLSAVLFASMHVQPIKLPFTFAMGIITGWWYVGSRSIWLGVAGHAANNLVAAAAILGSPKDGGQATVSFDGDWLALGAGILVFLFGLQSMKSVFGEIQARQVRPLSSEEHLRPGEDLKFENEVLEHPGQ